MGCDESIWIQSRQLLWMKASDLGEGVIWSTQVWLTEVFLVLSSMIAIPPLVDEDEIVRVTLSPGAIFMR
jgi:hypothetical protein